MKHYSNSKIISYVLLFVVAGLFFSYFAYSLSVGNTGGGQISLANVSRIGKEGVTGNFTNVSGGIRLNATVAHNQGAGPFGGITNLSFVFIHSDGTRSSFNLTNASVNATGTDNVNWLNVTFWNISLDSTNLKDGNYTITVNASNFTGANLEGLDPQVHGYKNATFGNVSSNNLAFAIVIDNSPPSLHFLFSNASNRTNVTSSNAGSIQFNISANDSLTWSESVVLGLRNTTSQFNTSAPRAASFAVFTGIVWLQNTTISDDEYQVFLYINDSLNNTNTSVAGNFSIRKDTTPPVINNFSLVYRGIMHFNLSNSSNSTPQFMVNFSDNMSLSANCTIFINATLNVSNGAVPNSTATNLSSTGVLAEGNHIAYASCIDGATNQGNSTNTTGLGALVFRVDTTQPSLHFVFSNVSNRTNVTTTTVGSLQFNVSANDSLTFTQSVLLGLRNVSSELNHSTSRAASFAVFSGITNLQNTTIADDEYQVFLYINDSVGNINTSVAGNFSIRKDTTPPSYNLFHMFGRNGSTVNLTNLSATSADFRFNFTDNLSISANCTLFVNNTFAASNTSSVNSTALNLTATSMVEGKHIAHVSCIDGSSNLDNTTSAAAGLGALTFTVDTIAPNLSAETFVFGNFSGFAGHDARYVGLNLSAGLSEGNYTLMVVVNDSSTNPQHVRFNISNSSGVVVPFNYTAVRNGTNYSAFTFNVSRLKEGWYNITVWTNDTVNNINGSLRLPFVIDRTKPAVTVSCTPASPKEGETISCTCTSSDDYPGSGKLSGEFEGGGTSVSTTATGSSGTSSVCRSTDHAGNVQTATASWTVAAASSGGSGGGGSGGGVSSGAAGDFEQKTWTSILADETAILEPDNGELGITKIEFGVSKTVYGPWIKVEKLAALPSTVDAFDAKAYKLLQVTKGLTLTNDVLKNIKMDFKVMKTWLSENGLGKNEVALFHFENEQWMQLSTTVGEDDGTYVHYSAEVPGFSYFVIGEAKEAVAEAPAEEEAAGEAEAPAEVPTGEAAEEAAPEVGEEAPLRALWPWVLVVVIIAVVVAVVWHLRKPKK